MVGLGRSKETDYEERDIYFEQKEQEWQEDTTAGCQVPFQLELF